MNASFVRKVVYLVLIAILLVPLYLISAPSFTGADGRSSEGGLLTRQRREHGLAQSSLGDIDPASESMKLATLGMRGVAANILWEKANEYKKTEQWDALRATLNQIAKLQPNFISVWQFQAWNLSYNVSVEFDNYKHRYHWVKKGIDFLLQGIRYNRNEPRLLWDLGWFFGHKFGRSDEYRQFRREYRVDADFHDTLPINVDEARDFENKPDNWLTAYQWFKRAQDVVDNDGVTIKGKNPLVFHSDVPKALIRYGDAIESGENAVFGEVAANAWQRAYESWMAYGDRPIPTSYGYTIQLNDFDKWEERMKEAAITLTEAFQDIEEKLKAEREASLTDQEKELLKQNKLELDRDDYDIVSRAEARLEVTPSDVAKAVPADRKREARRLANRVVEAEAYSTTIRRYRDIVNFIYWRTRCEVERTDEAIKAREYLDQANKLNREGDVEGAREKYDQAWVRWAKIHAEHPVLAEDVTAEDLVDEIKKYRTLMGQLDEQFPPPGFPMLRLIANYASDLGFSEEEAAKFLEEADRMDSGVAPDEDNDESPANETSELVDLVPAEDDTVESPISPEAESQDRGDDESPEEESDGEQQADTDAVREPTDDEDDDTSADDATAQDADAPKEIAERIRSVEGAMALGAKNEVLLQLIKEASVDSADIQKILEDESTSEEQKVRLYLDALSAQLTPREGAGS